MAALAALLALWPVAADAGAPRASTLTVTPNADLVDHQTVAVTGTGWGRRRPIQVQQCEAGSTSRHDCAYREGWADTDQQGRLTGELDVAVLLQTRREILDCRVVDCVVRVTDMIDEAHTADVV